MRIIDKIEEAHKLVLEFFDGDEEKTDLWFSTENPMLGNVRPMEMAIWQTDKLLKFIKDSFDENKPPEEGK